MLWKRSPETQEVLHKIQRKIEDITKPVMGGALITSPYLEREYCFATAEVRGLRFIEELIKEEVEADDDNNS